MHAVPLYPDRSRHMAVASAAETDPCAALAEVAFAVDRHVATETSVPAAARQWDAYGKSILATVLGRAGLHGVAALSRGMFDRACVEHEYAACEGEWFVSEARRMAAEHGDAGLATWADSVTSAAPSLGR